MEDIHVQMKGSINVIKHEVDLSLDDKFKAGLYLQVEAFIMGEKGRLLNLKDHIFNCKIIHSTILNSNN